MRGSDRCSGALFSYVDLEARVPPEHPQRIIRTIVNDALHELDPEFSELYGDTGRDLIPPERLLRASLLQAFYSVRSERQLMESIDYNLLFRWFVGLGIDDPVWDHSTFSKNRDRLLEAHVAAKFFEAVLRHRKVRRFLSSDHFSVDGTLVKAWASMKSVRAREGSDEPPAPGRNGDGDFHGSLRKDDTHASTTDAQAKLFRKSAGKEAKLCFMAHALMENRSGLIVKAHVSQASGTAERDAALHMIEAHSPGSTRRSIAGLSGSPSSSHSRWPPTTSFACRDYWVNLDKADHDQAAKQGDRQMADLRSRHVGGQRPRPRRTRRMRFNPDGRGEFMFICVSATMDCGYSPNGADFDFRGFDEMDETSGSGDADLGDDGSLTVVIKFFMGDEATLKARQW